MMTTAADEVGGGPRRVRRRATVTEFVANRASAAMTVGTGSSTRVYLTYLDGGNRFVTIEALSTGRRVSLLDSRPPSARRPVRRWAHDGVIDTARIFRSRPNLVILWSLLS